MTDQAQPAQAFVQDLQFLRLVALAMPCLIKGSFRATSKHGIVYAVQEFSRFDIAVAIDPDTGVITERVYPDSEDEDTRSFPTRAAYLDYLDELFDNDPEVRLPRHAV